MMTIFEFDIEVKLSSHVNTPVERGEGGPDTTTSSVGIRNDG